MSEDRLQPPPADAASPVHLTCWFHTRFSVSRRLFSITPCPMFIPPRPTFTPSFDYVSSHVLPLRDLCCCKINGGFLAVLARVPSIGKTYHENRTPEAGGDLSDRKLAFFTSRPPTKQLWDRL